jgi:hypothetical protein
MAQPKLTNEIIDAAIFGFEEQKRRLDSQIAGLREMRTGAATKSPLNSAPAKSGRRKMSAAGRKAIAEAQRKRWAAAKGESSGAKVTAKPKRKLSAEGRAAIVAALKKRWAAKKTAVKK